MTLSEKRDKADIISKEADIVYKKIVVLLAIVGGSGAYSIEFLKNADYVFGFIFLVVFIFVSFGISINYRLLSQLKQDIKDIKDG